MTGRIGVAISTTGDEHRLPLLIKCVAMWQMVLPPGSVLFVTVDGDEETYQRILGYLPNAVRVGQCADGCKPLNGRMGVAVNKNTGLELLMDHGRVQHTFLCDDDTWPLQPEALRQHTDSGLAHSMLCWGRNRNPVVYGGSHARWSWPRGALIHTRTEVLAVVGGMDERFGAPGGHEHVEWSRRIHQAGLTPVEFPSPARYGGHQGMGAAGLWHAEDMPRPGEPRHALQRRKQALTTIHRPEGYWERAEWIMAQRDGDTSYVPFRARENGRSTATLATPLRLSPGASASEQEPRSQHDTV